MEESCDWGDRFRAFVAAFLALLVAFVCPSAIGAQDPGAPAAGLPPKKAPPAPPLAVEAGPTEAALRAKVKEIADAEGLSDADRKTLTDLYNQALGARSRQNDFIAKAAAYEETAKGAPQRIRQLEAASSQPASRPAAAMTTGMALKEVEAKLKQLQLDLTNLEKEAGEISLEVRSRATRQTELPKTIAATQDKLKAVQDDLAKVAGSAEPQHLKDARRLLLEVQAKTLQAELLAYQKQLATFDVRGSLLRAQQTATAHRLVAMQGRIKVWEAEVVRRREEEAARQLAAAREAERQAAEKHEIIQELRKKNTDLAKYRMGPDGLNEKQEELTRRLKQTKDELSDLEKSFEKIQNMVKEVGSTQAIGILLRKLRRDLPDPREQGRRSAARRVEMGQVRLRLFELGEMSSDLADTESLSRRLVSEATPPIPADKRDDVLASARKALQDRKQMLSPLIDGYDSYFRALVELDTAEKRLLSQAQKFRAYIDERIFWTRSTAALGTQHLRGCWEAMAWLVDGESWGALGRAVWEDILTIGGMVGVAALALVIALRRKMRASLSIAAQTASNGAASFRRTLWSVVLTVLLAGTGPLVLAFIGWRLAVAGGGSSFALAWGQGMMIAAGVWLPLAVVRQACRKTGVGPALFRWPRESSRRLGRSMVLLAAVAVPLVLLVGTIERQDVQAHRDSLGRIGLILLLLGLAAYLAVMFRPAGPFLTEALARRKKGWLYRYRRLWHRVAVLVPLALALAGGIGYHYTAVQLSSRLLLQIWILVLLVVLHAMLANWLLHARRVVARRALAQRRQAQQVEKDEIGATTALAPAEEQEVDLAAVNVQTRQLVQYVTALLLLGSVWAIWADVLTALGILRQVTLWNVTSGAGDTPITLAHLAGAVVVLVLTSVAYRNVSGLLEVTLFGRLHVDTAGRYAISQLIKYMVSVVGVVWAVSMVGVKWAQIQWLVAAMTVGLGFGLQEIFANFVSGLIILFERPIRVGDTVTVGEVSGTVSRIRIRATTIIDWDRKELIVPNKEFVTGRLVNWTLSDKVLRVTLKVGIAYGSDTDLAETRLREVAAAHPLVLEDPPPVVLFHNFGDSALNFELRVYIAGIENYLKVWHAMNRGIDVAFRESGIEIAFPQRDIHVRTPAPPGPFTPDSSDGRALDPPGSF